jgi:hypothetical protein
LTNRPEGLSRQKKDKSFLQLNPAGSELGQPAGATDLDFAGDLEICLQNATWVDIGGCARCESASCHQSFAGRLAEFPRSAFPIPAQA